MKKTKKILETSLEITNRNHSRPKAKTLPGKSS